MDQLPHELVERICGFLEVDDLKKTVTVSRSFQYASERASGAYAEYDLTRDNAQAFISLYNGRRWQYLRHVQFRTQLPPYGKGDEDETGADSETEETHNCRESLQELQENDALFSKEISFVFKTLRTIEDQTTAGKFQLTIYTPVREMKDVPCPHRKCVSWRLHLQNPDALPELSSVRALSVSEETVIYPLEEDESSLRLDLRVLIDLAVKLPQLEYLGCNLDSGRGWTSDYSSEEALHYLRDWAGPHRDSRHDFAKAFEQANLPSTLRQAQLNFINTLSLAERIDQTEAVPDLVSPAKNDPFSSSLGLLTQQLRKLELQVVADDSLFWPSDGAASWPHLESICIMFHMTSPSGRWYFQGPDGYGADTKGFEVTDASYPPLKDTPEDEEVDDIVDDNIVDVSDVNCCKFRIKPNEEVLEPFLASFAKAAANMPALKEALLWAPLLWDADSVGDYENFDVKQLASSHKNPLAWGITYIAPSTFGFHVYPGQHYIDSRQIWWTVGQWRPSEELHQLWQSIGDQSTELIEYWEHDDSGDKLATREMFKYFELFGYRHPDSPWPVKL